MLTADMKRIIEEQRLGFVATAAPDGTPNVSPKGTFIVLDDETIAFGNGSSKGTPIRTPITGIARSCACALSGHAAAPPTSPMNSRRLT
jgi:Pyridoxamine 5'-phosphate oxidase